MFSRSNLKILINILKYLEILNLQVAVLTAMKMETNVTARINGKVARVLVGEGDEVAVGDLLMEVDARTH